MLAKEMHFPMIIIQQKKKRSCKKKESASIVKQPRNELIKEDQAIVLSQKTSQIQRSNSSLIENECIDKYEQIPAGFMLTRPNSPHSAETGYADCLIFSLVQHANEDYAFDSTNNKDKVKNYREMLVNNGYLNSEGGFGPDGYIHSNSSAAKKLINAINDELISAGSMPLKVIFHEFSPDPDNFNQSFEYLDAYGPSDGRTVHIQNTGQHFESLVHAA